jgi:hypothetical protein
MNGSKAGPVKIVSDGCVSESENARLGALVRRGANFNALKLIAVAISGAFLFSSCAVRLPFQNHLRHRQANPASLLP